MVLTLMSLYTKADHIVGYDMNIIYLTGDTYKVRVTIFKDNRPFTVPMPSGLSFKTYVNGTNADANLNFNAPLISSTVLTFDSSLCAPGIANSSILMGVFEYSLTSTQALALNNTAGYYFSSPYCCRRNGLTNITNDNSTGISITMDFPRLSAGSATRYNSSPSFTLPPLTFFCVGKAVTLNFQGADPNGDSLVYSLIAPSGGSNAHTKPFTPATYEFGYGLSTNILNGAPDLSINPSTGVITFLPTMAGVYLVAFKCEEWRKINGVPVKIGYVVRELQFETVLCLELPPLITDINKKTNIIRDTVNITDSATYTNSFLAKEQPGDQLYFKIVPEQGTANNILNDTYFNVKWGVNGTTLTSGSALNNLVLTGTDSIKTSFVWKLDSTDIKTTPYRFKLIAFDKTCPTPLADTLTVELSVLGQCFQSSSRNLLGCDSVIDYLGRTYYSSINLFDTVQSIMGCDTILSQFITVNKSSKSTIAVQGCDSVLAIDGKVYYQNDTVKMIVTNAKNCDSVITQNILVYHTPIAQKINGLTAISDVSVNYYYGTTQQSDVNYLWVVNNGSIISGQGTNVAEIRWLTAGQGTLKCMVSDQSNTCADSSQLAVNITTSVYNPLNSTLKIFPNPTQNIINITGLNKNQATLVTLHDVQGKLILSTTITENGSIDLSDLSQGVYLVKVGEVVQRFLKIEN